MFYFSSSMKHTFISNKEIVREKVERKKKTTSKAHESKIKSP